MIKRRIDQEEVVRRLRRRPSDASSVLSTFATGFRPRLVSALDDTLKKLGRKYVNSKSALSFKEEVIGLFLSLGATETARDLARSISRYSLWSRETKSLYSRFLRAYEILKDPSFAKEVRTLMAVACNSNLVRVAKEGNEDQVVEVVKKFSPEAAKNMAIYFENGDQKGFLSVLDRVIPGISMDLTKKIIDEVDDEFSKVIEVMGTDPSVFEPERKQ